MTAQQQQNRQPKGAPTGGQYAEARRPGADVTLDVPDAPTGPPAGAEVELFELDEIPALLGYESGQERNGFAQPWLTEQSMERIAEATTRWRDEDEAAPLVYKAEPTGEWVVDEGIDLEETSDSGAKRVRPVEKAMGPGARKVYRLPDWTFSDTEPWEDEVIGQVANDEIGHYLDAARFTSVDTAGSRAELEVARWSDQAKTQMREELTDFISANQHLIQAARAARPEYDSIGNVGDDFWLTRNGHGSGFWDRGLGAVGDELTAAAKAHGSADVYLGEDGQLHLL